jgi:hypothetical protein
MQRKAMRVYAIGFGATDFEAGHATLYCIEEDG